MSEFLPDLITRLRLDTTEMDQGVGKAAAIGGAIGGAIGTLAVAGLSAAASGIKDFVTGSVEAFSAIEDATGAAGVVFGDSMGIIEAQAASAATTLGLSSRQVIDAANTFGTFGKSAGLSGDELAGFSTQMTGLAGDLASFKGTSPEQAIEAIGAALRGESEPIRAYGVLLDDATLKARAMEMGIYSGTGSLTAQQKVLASQAEILAQTGDAQGDYARTSESTANTQKTLAASAENLQAKFGTLLAPAFTAVRGAGIDLIGSLSGVIDNLIPKFEVFYGRASDTMSGLRSLFAEGDFTSELGAGLGVSEDSPVIGFLFGLRDTAISVGETLGPVFSGIGDTFGALLPSILELLPSVMELVSSFSPLGLVLKILVPLLPMITGFIGQLAGMLVGVLGQVLPIVSELAGVLIGALVGAFQQLMPVISALLPFIGQLVGSLGGILVTAIQALLPILLGLIDALLPIIPILLQLLDPVMAVVSALLPLVAVVGSLISVLLPPLLDIFTAILVPVADLAVVLVNALVPVIELLVTVLVPVITLLGFLIGKVLELAGPVLGFLVNILAAVIGWLARTIASFATWLGTLGGVGAAIGRMVDSVTSGIGQVVAWFARLPGQVIDTISSLSTKLYNAGRDVISGFIEGIGSMAGRIISSIKSTITDALPAFVKKALGIASPSRLFRLFGQQTGEGFALGLDDATAGVGAAAESMVSAVSGVQVAPPQLTAGVAYQQPSANPSGAGGLGAQGGIGALQIKVYLGDKDVSALVRTEVTAVLGDEAQAIAMGSVS